MIVGGICRDFDCLLPEHEHSEAQLTVVFAGEAPSLVTHDETGRTRKRELQGESFLFMTPGQPHRVNWDSYGEVLHLWMKQDDLRELAEQTRCPLPVSQTGDHLDRGIYEVGRMLVDEFDSTGGLTPTLLNHATSLMVMRVLRVSERLSRDTPTGLLSLARLQPAINRIHDCPEKEFKLAELAALCNASVFHFARSFTARIGCAPFAYQRQLRLKKAQVLLISTELSVDAVASLVGFESAAHFSRIFRRQTGYAPRAYKRLHAAN
jgi:AraC family transcriptional regulator